MNTTKSKSGSGANGSTSKRKSGSNGTQKENTNIGMPPSQLMKLFEEELKDIYWAEKALTKAIPKMIKNATSEELIEALENHWAEKALTKAIPKMIKMQLLKN